MRNLLALPLTILFFVLTAAAQSFSSGSTGVDGPLDLTSGDRTVQLPDSGTLNYTTITIPAGRTLSFLPSLSNSPVVMLAQGAVNVAGTINLSANLQNPGPGGFRGGDPGRGGWGPGAGSPEKAQAGGLWIGPLSLVPNIGGSGASGFYVGPGSPYGWNCWDGGSQPAGGGGGGALTLASSVSIAVSGAILTSGDSAWGECNLSNFRGFRGADGAIRIVSNSINVSGNLTASTVRLEAPLNNLTYTGTGTAPVRSTINPTVVPSNPPSIIFSSIGGYAVPAYSGSSFSTIDLLLPAQLQDPIPIVVKGSNIPAGSAVSISYSGPGSPTFTTATLTGSAASSTATIYASGMSRSGVTFLFVLTTFDPSLIAINIPKGPNSVSKVEVASAPGGKPTYRFLRADGSEVSMLNVPVELRKAFGL